MIDLKGYTILITGAASGNGYGISSFCSDYFSKLILVDKNEEALNKAKENLYKNQTLKNKNINIDIFKCDLSCKEEINLLIQKITDSNMPIHCLVNNAGITLPLNKNLNLHEKFKQENGYSLLEIDQKRKAIEQVLKTETEHEHLQRLKRVGFRAIYKFFQNFNFASFLAIK